jgi:hypothetical protein
MISSSRRCDFEDIPSPAVRMGNHTTAGVDAPLRNGNAAAQDGE